MNIIDIIFMILWENKLEVVIGIIIIISLYAC